MIEDDTNWPEVVTMEDGEIKVPYESHYQFLSVVGEENAADTLTKINGGRPGDLLLLQSDDDDADITVDDTYISCGGSDQVLGVTTDKILLVCVGENDWNMVSSTITT